MRTSSKRVALATLTVLLTGLAGCERFDDSDIRDSITKLEREIDDHERRLSELEGICRRLNSDIAVLRQLLEAVHEGLSITDYLPVTEGDRTIGYSIRFSDGSAITLFNGKDGTDGKAPVIGAKEDENGVICWTVDGEWLTDANGDHVPCIGETGEDGITPVLRISEDGFWEISYDNGLSFEKVGKASGEDQEGSWGSIAGLFKSIEFVTGEDGAVHLVIVLSDGSTYSIRTETQGNGPVEEDVSRTNRNIMSLTQLAQALKNGIPAVSFQLKEDGSGWTFKLSDGRDIPFVRDDETPEQNPESVLTIGLRSEDGVLCWTVEGETMLNEEGRPVPLAGPDDSDGGSQGYPVFRVSEGRILISPDGTSFAEMPHTDATDEKTASFRLSFIKSAFLSDDGSSLTIVLGDGGCYTVRLGRCSSSMVDEMKSVKTVTVGKASFDMNFVEHGTFMMGDGYFAGIWDASSPYQKVTISKDMWVCRKKMSGDVLAELYADAPSWASVSSSTGFQILTLPEGEEFIERLSDVTGLMMSLPTSAQWEWFATGGRRSEGHIYWGADSLPSGETEKYRMVNELGLVFGGRELTRDGFFRYGTFGEGSREDEEFGYIDPYHSCDYQNGIVIRGLDQIRRRSYNTDYRAGFRLVCPAD